MRKGYSKKNKNLSWSLRFSQAIYQRETVEIGSKPAAIT